MFTKQQQYEILQVLGQDPQNYDTYEQGRLTTHEKSPTPTPTQIPQNPQSSGFACDTRQHGVQALQAIPREPLTILASFDSEQSGDQATVPFSTQMEGEVGLGAPNLDAAVGMYLCEMEVDFSLTLDGAAPADQATQDAYIAQLMRSGRITLRFRGEDVAGFRNMRIGELVWNPECCDEVGKCVGSILPDRGILEAEVSVPTPPAGIVGVVVSTSIEANGCGCNCSRKSCGC